MFGIIHKDLALCLALNHLVIIGKYLLNVNALNSKLYAFNKFFSLVSEKIIIEKDIIFTSGREKEFKTKWFVFSSFFRVNLRSHLFIALSSVFCNIFCSVFCFWSGCYAFLFVANFV